MSAPLNIQLSRDEALVLFEFFARFEDENLFRLRNNAEFVAFMKISGQLEKALVEPFQPNYRELLATARACLAEEFEGLAPRVESETKK